MDTRADEESFKPTSPPSDLHQITTTPYHPIEGDTGKKRVRPAWRGLGDLPPTIIEHILYITDPNSFSSLVLLNRCWHQTSQNPHLYAYQLARCFAYSLSNDAILGPFQLDDLPRLRQKFAIEVKRNLFESYLKPKETIIRLISVSTSSSAAFPQGEAFRFSFSPNGGLLLALSSSRIHIIDLRSDTVEVIRELKTPRRPVLAEVLDDGSLLAVLSDNHQMNIYDLSHGDVHLIRSLALESTPRAVAISPAGTVLAAAYAGGIEVYSLAPSALSTDRRAVKCDPVDSLEFSKDGNTLLGTTTKTLPQRTVLISAPGLHEGGLDLSDDELQSRMWTTQILFPGNTGTYSYASLVPRHNGEDEEGWLMLYDGTSEALRIAQIDDMQKGNIYLTGLRTANNHADFAPITFPSVTHESDLAAGVFCGDSIRLFGLPERLNFVPYAAGMSSGVFDWRSHLESARNHATNHEGSSEEPQEDLVRPRWSTMQDKDHKLLLEGRLVGTISGISGIKFIRRDIKARERLVAVAPGGVNEFEGMTPEGDIPADGGRILVYDFEWGLTNGERSDLTIEVGEKEAGLLSEEKRTLETEVALARRRTVAQNRGGLSVRRNSGRNATPSSGSIQRVPTTSRLTPQLAIPSGPSRLRIPLDDENLEQLEEPYSHNQPRSRSALHRAATVSPNRNPRYPIQNAPTDGRQIPHESDADNWSPPPPPYTPDPDVPLPPDLQLTLMPRRTEPLQRVLEIPPQPARANTTFDDITTAALQRTRSTIERTGSRLVARRSSQRTAISSGIMTERRPSTAISGPSRTHQNQRVSSEPTVGGARNSLITSSYSLAESSLANLPLASPSQISRRPVSRQTHAPPTIHHTSTSVSSNASDRSSISLTGSSLRSRLDYPVPPPPNEGAQELPRAGYLTSAPPNAEQIGQSDRRYSRPPSSILSSSTTEYQAFTQARASLGVPNAISPANSGQALSPSGILSHRDSRASRNSRGSAYSFSASTPNLLARPNNPRLDTIRSEASTQSNNSGAVRQRSRSNSQSTSYVSTPVNIDSMRLRGYLADTRQGRRKSFKLRLDSAAGGHRYGSEDSENRWRKKGGKCTMM
ncbi:MAG: hypothetical protein M1834_004677 [Cirrosporium novae-zelandiae]|nr:MAG: hypothetical protein M1834_004677 [Cirrosporium novae-zelandiae]